MATVRRIDDEASAAALADLLNGSARKRPVVVVTVPTGRTAPWIDAERIAEEAADLGEVYVMPTGPFTWEFSDRMPEGTQVYGGAGRVYPVGHAWASDPTKSPLRFAFNAEDGVRATDRLVSDTLRMAAPGGLLLGAVRPRARKRVTGVVKMTVAGRALVDVGDAFPAALVEELTLEGVPIDRIVTVGQHVEGWYDVATKRIDVTTSLRSADEALACYELGDVVLARVTEVESDEAVLTLYPATTTPAVTVTVRRDDVTANPHDDLGSLMTVGEVIPARIVAQEPAWQLVLHDVDDDEPVVAAPSLLPGGPPWLVGQPDEVEAPPMIAPAPLRMPAAMPTYPAVEEPAPAEPVLPAPSARQRPPAPSPLLLDRKRARPVGSVTVPSPSPAAPAGSTRSLLLQIDGLKAELKALRRERESFRDQVLAATDEREQLHYLLDQAERRAHKAENDLVAARARLRKARSTKRVQGSSDGPRFADPEQGFRYLVLTRWATRTLPDEQADRPLPDYDVGPRFLESLEQLEGIKVEKVADVAFEVVTGIAQQLPGREVHRLRTGTGGDDPVRVRDDGAVAWRAALQVRTPSARRLHYWVRTDGRVELARVTTHDDFDI